MICMIIICKYRTLSILLEKFKKHIKMKKIVLLGTTFSINGKVHDLILGVYDLSELSSEEIIDIKKRGIERYKFWHGISSQVDWYT